VVAAGADLAAGTLLSAYRRGLFPMPARVPGGILWWSPEPRGILELDAFRPSRSLQRSRRHFEIRIDTSFRAVMEACAATPRPGGWITPAFVEAYTHLHELGWAHSVEVLDDAGTLVGGLYGVGIGGFFAGESMFHRATDASKVALWALVEVLARAGATLLDVQWATGHLRSLGVTEIPRSVYLQRLNRAVHQPVAPFAAAVTGE
jgi:leucyl/phenylalanyl-tRNA---protein transferase